MFFHFQTLKHCISEVFRAMKLGKASFDGYFSPICPSGLNFVTTKCPLFSCTYTYVHIDIYPTYEHFEVQVDWEIELVGENA